jgi:small nuclear ribonucleoprotein (snRNP)-like protein
VTIFVVSILVIIDVVLAAGWYLDVRSDSLRGRVRADVIVTLKTGDEFQGVLFEQDRRILILRGATQHLPQAVIPVDGELLIRWDDVAYIQKP